MPRLLSFVVTYFLLVFFLYAKASFANGLWWQELLSERPLSEVKQVIKQSGEWYECDTREQVAVMCLDEFHYYNASLYGELTSNNQSMTLSLLAAYDAQTLSDLILNLRKDGFVMSALDIGDEHYDVREALQQQSPEAVDRDVVLLMNQYPQDVPRTLDWLRAQEFEASLPKVKANLTSDGEMLELTITRL
ncbi:hypothetical protein [Vibrio hyugaensis]|uniref:hypothetical protein n=1 Tax=Vibrio hyugaensis TaxID=1534743 RepID=UPI003DA12D7C